MKAMILAAGVGSRLRPLTDEMPKPMIPVVGKPVMEHIVELLVQHGFNEIYANLNYLPDAIERYFGDGARWGVKMAFSLEKDLLGTAGAVKKLEKNFDGIFIIMMGDAITNCNLSEAIEFHKKNKSKATIVVKQVEDTSQFGVVVFDENGSIKSFQEKPKKEEAKSNWANVGIYIFEPEILKLIPANTEYDFGHQLFPKLIEEKVPFYACGMELDWSDIGSFGELAKVNQEILKGRYKGIRIRGRHDEKIGWLGLKAQISPTAKIEYPIYIGENSKILDNAEIKNCSVIGDNTIVAEGATISQSLIIGNTYVGPNVEIEDSIINKNCIINVKRLSKTFVSDPFILGDVNQQNLSDSFFSFINKILAAVAFLITSPIWIIIGLMTLLTKGKFFIKKPVVGEEKMVNQQGKKELRNFGLWTFNTGIFFIDSLPKLLNVLIGEMNLVGNCPVTSEEANKLTNVWEKERFRTVPGIISLRRLSGRDIEEEEGRVIDNYYALTRTNSGDIKILLKAVFTLKIF